MMIEQMIGIAITVCRLTLLLAVAVSTHAAEGEEGEGGYAEGGIGRPDVERSGPQISVVKHSLGKRRGRLLPYNVSLPPSSLLLFLPLFLPSYASFLVSHNFLSSIYNVRT